MASTELLLSRLLDLVKYRQWSPDDVVDLFTALVKQHRKRGIKTDFYTWMAKLLYQVEIHKISRADLLSNNGQSQFVDDIGGKINEIVTKTKEKSLKDVLDEIKAEKDIDAKILQKVDTVLSASRPSDLSSTELRDIKEKLVKLCNVVKYTKKLQPRWTQMVSWCIMVLSDSSQLIQVGTGEGKSCIVAMFAAYLTMIGEKVDIISSSPVLAERDAEEWRPFYEKLGISVACNTNNMEVEELRKCYACQVVYGTSTDFAGDWLRDQFKRENVRLGRKFQCVIVDEVDSLMLDKGPEVVYINSEMPVMELLNVILAKIWCVVNQFEGLDVEKTLDLIRSFLLDKELNLLPSYKHVKTPANVPEPEQSEIHIPGFLEHINGRLKIWIENAFLAKTMTLGHKYTLHNGGVAPLDYNSTGVVQNDMKWGDGLQQFLEMKHQTRITNMSLMTNFKSNKSLFQSYKRIYGLTGTLGGQPEKRLLKKLYPGMKTCKIPPFKLRKLYEKDGIVVNDEDGWVETICKVVNEEVNPTAYRGSRAVLVICETIKQAEMIHKELSRTISTAKMKLYTNNNMDNSNITDKVANEGRVIVATNLAGRGTDLKVSTQVNASGGLFVVQTFLPLNIRVEQQAFDRTARQGNPGSAQLIMCSKHFSDSIMLMMVLNSPLSGLLQSCLLRRFTATVFSSGFIGHIFEETLENFQEDPNEKNCEVMEKELRDLLCIAEPSGLNKLELEKECRDLIVQMRQSKFLEDDIPEISKKEELFSEYLKFLENCGDINKDIVSSLHECWGMWLLTKLNENESTETLKKQLQKVLQSAKEKLCSNQSPSSMIYHYIRTGNTLRHKGSLADSIELYTRAIETNPCWPAIALYNRALSIISKGNRGHIAQALADLKNAEEEVDYHRTQLKLTLTLVKLSSETPNMTSDTELTKQFETKLLAQDLLKSNIQEAIKVLHVAESQGYNVRIIKDPVRFLVPNDILFKKDRLVCQEIMNFHSLELDTIFSLKTVFPFFKRLSKICN